MTSRSIVSLYTVSYKQKINSKSSTEAELIAVDDCIAHVLRIRHFLLEQGYKAAEVITILQDNQSAILLEQNGILSSTRRTKHLNVRYFFVKQKIDDKEVTIVWCPTDKLVGDFFSKPLSGAKFIEFRGKIMNLKDLEFTVQVDQCFHQCRLTGIAKDTPKHSVIKTGYPSKEHHILSTSEKELESLNQDEIKPVDISQAYELAKWDYLSTLYDTKKHDGGVKKYIESKKSDRSNKKSFNKNLKSKIFLSHKLMN